MLTRLPMSTLFGGAISLALFWALWNLISGPINIGPTVKSIRIDFTTMRPDTQPIDKTMPPKKIKLVDPPTIPGGTHIKAEPTPVPPTNALPNPGIGGSIGTDGMRVVFGKDAGFTPLVTINPNYPPRALARGTEGWVIVQFTVTTTGGVSHPTVVDADPPGVFEDAALQAISHWRFNPKIVNGQPVQSVGVQRKITFKLTNQ